jgi:hypothetical protein
VTGWPASTIGEGTFGLDRGRMGTMSEKSRRRASGYVEAEKVKESNKVL